MSFTDGAEPGMGAGLAFAVIGGAVSVALGTMLIFLAEASTFDLLFSLEASFFAFLVALVVIGLAAAFIGLPLTWVLTHYRLERPWAYPVAGYLAGAALVVFVPALTGDLRGGSVFEFLPWAWIGGLPGAICGTIWWVFYRRRIIR